jgi:hypothetical protein
VAGGLHLCDAVGMMDANDESRLYQGIQVNQGSVRLNLTTEQYNKLISA